MIDAVESEIIGAIFTFFHGKNAVLLRRPCLASAAMALCARSLSDSGNNARTPRSLL